MSKILNLGCILPAYITCTLHTYLFSCWSIDIQRLPELVIQKSAVITYKLEEIIWSVTFQKLRLVLKFSFAPPDGISPVQCCCLEILPVIMRWYVTAEPARCCLRLDDIPSSTSVQRIFRTKCHKHASQRMAILGSQARVDLVLQMRPQQMCGSAPVWSWTNPKQQCGRFWRSDCVAGYTDYNWCKLWAMVTKKNDMRFVVECLTKWKTKMITWLNCV